jgi:hypothetical protein
MHFRTMPALEDEGDRMRLTVAGGWKRLGLCGRVLLIVGLVIILKLAAHWHGWVVLSVNPLFSGIIAANVFLMGFLLSGVLTDYKESERLPGDLACSLEAIADEVRPPDGARPPHADGSVGQPSWFNGTSAAPEPSQTLPPR